MCYDLDGEYMALATDELVCLIEEQAATPMPDRYLGLTWAEVAAEISEQAATEARRELLAKVEGLAGQDIAVTPDYDGAPPWPLSPGVRTVPPVRITVTNAPPTSGFIERAAVLRLIEGAG